MTEAKIQQQFMAELINSLEIEAAIHPRLPIGGDEFKVTALQVSQDLKAQYESRYPGMTIDVSVD